MKLPTATCLVLSAIASVPLAFAQDGYIGYRLEERGDPDSVLYQTEETTAGAVLPVTPDVYLNASVHVGEIDINVENLTAKINLDAKVLNLLQFNAGVTASINRVTLNIENVTAKVLLEARLENVVSMIDDVLSSIDLNPIVATLGNDLGNVVGNVTSDLGGGSSTSPTTKVKRSTDSLDYNIQHNILYSINNYSGDKHTNRILGKDGTLYDVFLDNDGNETGRRNVGSYKRDMSFTGHNRTITVDGQTEFETGYMYTPYAGLDIYAYIYLTESGKVVKTQVVSEAEGGGTSTISDDTNP